MNPTLKKFLVIAAKHAVNAIITNTVLMAKLPTIFNLHSHDGIWNVVTLAASVIGAREALVWLPLLNRWSTTNADPNGDPGTPSAQSPAGGAKS